jgi:hypothetical protein
MPEHEEIIIRSKDGKIGYSLHVSEEGRLAVRYLERQGDEWIEKSGHSKTIAYWDGRYLRP